MRGTMSFLGQKQACAAHTATSAKCQMQTSQAWLETKEAALTWATSLRNGFSSSAERVAKSDDALYTIHFRAWSRA
jgi:hypothetical protein